jgi:hypothetical protein
MRRRFGYLGIVSTIAVGFATYSCSGVIDRGAFSGGSGGDSWGTSNGGAGGAGNDCIFCTGSGQDGGPVQTLVLSPMNPTLNVIDANIQTQVFTVTLNGVDVSAQVQWVYERPDIGDVGAAATFTPTGNVGGVGVLTAKYQGAEGSTNVTVNVKKTANEAGIGPAEMAAFDNPTLGADPGTIVYPYDETVFPLGVLTPEVQINNVQGGVYRLKITEKNLQYVAYFNANTPVRYLMNQKEWENVGASGTGSISDPLKVEISRLQGGQAFSPMSQTWHVAQGKVRGAVYYWELPGSCAGGSSDGRILKIKPDSATPEEFYFPGSCWGCHTVSRDGKTMAATLDNAFPFPQVTIDLAQMPAQSGPITAGNGLTGTFSAFNNTSDKIIFSNDDSGQNNASKVLRIVDAASGNVLNPDAMGAGCIEPAWSPDGTKLAAICGASGGGWGFDATGGYLATADVAADGISVSNVKQIVSQASGQGRPAYPSFTSDSQYIAFGRPTSGSRSTGQGDLWFAKTDGSEVKSLAQASIGNNSYNPVFAPQRAGGYYWLVFVSKRDYGNTLVSTNRQQLWMTAIDDPPSAADPSHPAFYMRGQEGCGLSENAYMAKDPCIAEGSSCVTGTDCCGGQCVKDPGGSGMYVCGKPPPPGTCSALGNSCTTGADCCDKTALCIDGSCQLKPPL